MRNSKLQRRGIVLLVVLSLLTLFAILGVTFLLVAGQYKVAARSNARVDQHRTAPDKLLHWAALQFLRDSNTRSMLQTHALLTDLYGSDGVRGIVIAAIQDSTVNGEFLFLRVVPDGNQPFGQTLSDQPDYYAGRVITFLNGRAGNISARVVDYTAFKGADGVWGTTNGGSSGNGNDNDNTYDDGSGNFLPDINERAERFWIDAAGNRSDDYAELRCELLDGRGTGAIVPPVGTQFLINGQPFNGTGHGYDPGTSNIDLQSVLPGTDGAWGTKGIDDNMNGIIDDISEAGWPMTDDVPEPSDTNPPILYSALLPNQMVQATPFSRVAGGADEDYDTFDTQNMYLALVPPDVTTVPEIIPSFHRPALINFWFNWAVGNLTSFSSPPLSASRALQWAAFSQPFGRDRILGTADDPPLVGTDQTKVISILRAINMRPLPEDNPDFDVNNPDFNLLGNRSGAVLGFGANGAWDVDNDGDGIPDSVWIDVGLPVQTGADGRRYRPLVAILCQDLDSRLNVNAHDKRPRDSKVDPSSTVDATTTFLDPRVSPMRPLPGRRYYLNDLRNEYAGTYNTTTMVYSPVLLKRGLGLGGAEVSVGPIFNDQPLHTTYPPPSPAPLLEYEQVLIERYLSPGGNGYPGLGAPSLVSPQAPAADDPLSAVKFDHLPSNYFDYFNNPSSYLSPADLKGAMAIGLDPFGQPLPYAIPGADALIDDPYEMFLWNHFGEVRSSQDAPYTVSEFERLLRYNDREASRLPSRLVDRAPQTFSFRRNRQQTTVLSSYIPVPSSGMFPQPTPGGTGVPPQTLRGSSPATTIHDLYFQRLFDLLDLADPTGPSEPKEDTARARLASLLPFEFRHGQRFNLNRAFGNGVDDNGNKIVDEPSETTAGQKAWKASANVPVAFRNADFDSDNDDPLSTSPRIDFARHLYCLTVMLMGPSYELPSHPNQSPMPNVTQRIEGARAKIAQWAVNVVDFRDADAIMTGFEYDKNPFNGWNVDGDLGTDEGAERGVVWGCEAPDLLINETFAMHDRRVKDTKWDNGVDYFENPTGPPMLDRSDMPRDTDLDQYRIPQGSLFFELLCPRGNHLARQYELYDAAGNLDLARLSPSRTGPLGNFRQPVWRVAIVNDPATGNSDQNGASASSETYQMYDQPPSAIDRIVWFTTLNPSGNNTAAGKIFYNRSAVTTVAPNGYVMVGPRPSTAFGALRDTDGDPATHDDSPHRLSLSGGVFSATDSLGAAIATPPNIRTPRNGMICAANPPASWSNAGRQIGLNISEPLPQSGVYYYEPNPSNDSRDPVDAYADVSLPIVIDLVDPTVNNSLPDVPFDDVADPGFPVDTEPLNGIVRTGTRPDFRSCLLQRLADPTRAWNPDPRSTDPNFDSNLPVNPYVTVDWSSVDLTVFSGEENTNRRLAPSVPPVAGDPLPVDPEDEDPYTTAPQENVGARQRDGDRTAFPAVNRYNIWSTSTFAPNGTRPSQNVDAYFRFELNAASPSLPNVPGMTFGYLNSPFGNPTLPQPGYTGAPASPFPWMAWNNRPFSSPYELLMVPASSPGRLLLEFTAPTLPSNFFGATTTDPYSYGTNTFQTVSAPSAQSLNFLHSSAQGVSTLSGNFHRLLDFVEVPSPYIGAEKWYNPTSFAYNTSLSPAQNRGGDSFRPPFNKLSRFRDPGRVNVNTILFERSWSPGADFFWGDANVDDDGNGMVDDIGEKGWPGTDDTREARVWEGIAKNFPELDPSRHTGSRVRVGADGVWGSIGDDNGDGNMEEVLESEWPGSDDVTTVLFERLLLSRQGYGTHANDILSFRPGFPTRFNNPFRSSASADLNPLTSLRKQGVAATFMRPDIVPHTHAGADGILGNADDGTRTEPLFVPDPAIVSQVNDPYRDQDRNPYFRYQALQHIGNVLSTTSNTFAVWMTVGFFEVEDNPGGPDLVHPDGLRLGQELGLDTGEVKRHRAFYIIDRSIPVAYEPGQNHNVEKAILLRRFIE